jgi:acetylornithine deacetylase/succinyl-diaminopimelate desuccinylase-like protein
MIGGTIGAARAGVQAPKSRFRAGWPASRVTVVASGSRVSSLAAKRAATIAAALALVLGVVWRLSGDGAAGKHRPGSVGDRVERLRAWGVAHRGELVRDLAGLAALESVAAHPAALRETADALASRMRALGMEVTDLSAGGPPLLHARGGPFQPEHPARTVLFYAHYDGQAADASQWTATAPFEPRLYPGRFIPGHEAISLDGPIEEDARLYGRAVADDKGPIVVLLRVLEGIVEEDLGPTAIAVEILLDGEEESGDPNLGAALAAHPAASQADVLVSLDGPLVQSGEPTVVFGVRGIASFDLVVHGAFGDLHSGHYGNWAGNPAQELAWLLSTLKDPFTGEVKIDGFYACRRALSDAEERALAAIPRVDEQVKTELGIVRTESRWSLAEAVTYPSLNVRGVSAGDVGAQARTVVPARAEAALDIRLVPDCDTQPMLGLVRAHLERLGYRVLDREPTEDERRAGDRIVTLRARAGGYRGVRTPMDWEVARELVAAVAAATGAAPVQIPNMGGSLPFFHVEDALHMRVLALPLVNYDDNQHGPDENVRVGHLWRGFDVLASVLLAWPATENPTTHAGSSFDREQAADGRSTE